MVEGTEAWPYDLTGTSDGRFLATITSDDAPVDRSKQLLDVVDVATATKHRVASDSSLAPPIWLRDGRLLYAVRTDLYTYDPRTTATKLFYAGQHEQWLTPVVGSQRVLVADGADLVLIDATTGAATTVLNRSSHAPPYVLSADDAEVAFNDVPDPRRGEDRHLMTLDIADGSVTEHGAARRADPLWDGQGGWLWNALVGNDDEVWSSSSSPGHAVVGTGFRAVTVVPGNRVVLTGDGATVSVSDVSGSDRRLLASQSELLAVGGTRLALLQGGDRDPVVACAMDVDDVAPRRLATPTNNLRPNETEITDDGQTVAMFFG